MKCAGKMIGNTFCCLALVVAVVGCAGSKVHFDDVSLAKADLTRGHMIEGSATGVQVMCLIPIGINDRQESAYRRLKSKAGRDYITDIQISESWTYAVFATIHKTSLSAMAYPEKSSAGEVVAVNNEQPVDVSQYPYLDSTAAVLTFDARAGVRAEEVAILADRFEVEFGHKNVQKIVSRSKMKEVLELQKFSAVCSSTDCAIEAGQLLGVEYMVYGSVGCVGSVFTVNVYMTSVEKGNTVASAAVDYNGKIDGLLTEGMRKAVDALLRSAMDKKRP